MFFTIPTFSDPFWTQTTILDGGVYLLSFSYAQRERVYYISISLTDGTPLAMGIKIMCNVPLLGASRVDSRLPPGEIFAVATGPQTHPPGMGELGAGLRVELTYADSTEITRVLTAAVSA